MSIVELLVNLKNWSFEINGPYKLQEREAKAIRDTIAEVRADLSFLDYLRKVIPADQMDKYLYGYEKEAGHGTERVDRENLRAVRG